MKIYEITILGLTIVNPGKSKKDALNGFKQIAIKQGMNPDWIKLKNVKQRK